MSSDESPITPVSEAGLQPAFPPMFPADALREILSEVRTGNFNLQTVTKIVWVVGCLLASMGGISISQATVEQSIDHDLKDLDSNNICNKLEVEMSLCQANPDGTSQALPPGTLLNLIKLLLGLLPLFLGKK